MAHFSHIEIKSLPSENGTIFTKLYLDGKEIHGVRSVEFRQFAGELPITTIDLNALDISIDTQTLLYQKSMQGRQLMKIVFEDDEAAIS